MIGGRGRVRRRGGGRALADGGARQLTRFEDGGPIAGTRDIEISPDGTLTVVAKGARLQLWESDTGRNVVDVNHDWDMGDTVWSPDGEVIAYGDVRGTVRITDRSGDPVARLDRDDPGEFWIVEGVEFTLMVRRSRLPDGSRLVSADSNGQARVWALAIDELVDIAEGELVSSHEPSPLADRP